MNQLPTPRVLTLSRTLALCSALLFGAGALTLPSSDAHAAGASAGKGGKKKKGGAKKGGAKKGGAKKGGKKGKKKNDGIGPFPKGKYPTSERMRPLVLPDQMGEVGLDLGVGSFAGTTFAGTTVSFAYGIQDVFELGVGTGLALAPDVSWSGLSLQGHYLAYDSKDLDFAPGLILPINMVADTAVIGATIDLSTRYVLSDGFFLRFGQGAIPMSISPDFSLALSANGGFGYQINPKGVLFLDLNVLNILLVPDAHFSGLWETLSLSLGGQYTPTKDWDVGAALNLANTWKVDNSLAATVNLYGRYRF